jgi:multidrug efflux pump subunit AcrA (membrane-fusion protein)
MNNQKTAKKSKITETIIGLGSLLVLTSCNYLPNTQSKIIPPAKNKLVPVPIEKANIGDRENLLVVPTTAIKEENNTKIVLVGAPNQPPKSVPITTGDTTGDRTEITSGLQGTEHILIEASQPPENFKRE